MTSTAKNLLSWLAAALVIFLFWMASARIQRTERELSYSDFLVQLERGHVGEVTITGNSISGVFKNGHGFRTYAPPQAPGLVNRLLEKGVVVNARDTGSSSWLGHLISWTPIVIMIAFLIFFMRQMTSSPAASRAERRLSTKARVHQLLSGSEQELSFDEISERIAARDRADLGEVLYQMLREETVVFTARRKYRVNTEEGNVKP